MNHHYLEKTGDSLCFKDAADFQRQIEELDLTVPPRNRRRQSFHRERYCLVKYLVALSDSGGLQWPSSVLKFERPDFLLVDNTGKLIGIEQADFGSRENQQQLAMLQAGKIQSIPPVLDTGPNSGQFGESRDEEPFSRFALATVLRKTRLISRKPYSPCDELRLLLYANTGLENVDILKVSPLLLHKWQDDIKRYNLKQPFASISLTYGSDEVWFDFAHWSRTPQRHITSKTPTLPLLK